VLVTSRLEKIKMVSNEIVEKVYEEYIESLAGKQF